MHNLHRINNFIRKTKPDGSKTIYVGGIYEVDKTSGGSVTRTVTYYPVAGAMRINITLYYILKDHLGSASVVTDASGVTVGEQRYYPYGETRLTTGAIYTDKLFTGQREITGLGIYHYGARFYSPKTGRFLSADTIVQSYANPQSLNRYSYVGNSPLRYTDPTGHTRAECGQDGDDCDHDDSGGNNNNNNNNDGGGNDPNDPTDDEDECDAGHCYETSHVVCPAIYECTAKEMQYYARMFQYPGQNPLVLVKNGYTYFVFPAPQMALLLGNPSLIWTGAIKVYISPDGLTLTNRSLPTHIFHDGQVVRSYTQREDGAWVVTSTGTGTNVRPYVGPAIDLANDMAGAPTFTAVDAQMLAYITNDQILSETFPRWIIPWEIPQ